MATKLDTTPKYNVTDQAWEDACNLLRDYYSERGTGFAIVDTDAVLRFWGGKPLSVQSALSLAHKLIETETFQVLLQRLMAQEQAAKEAAEKAAGKKKK
jgi:hypothetical protein